MIDTLIGIMRVVLIIGILGLIVWAIYDRVMVLVSYIP